MISSGRGDRCSTTPSSTEHDPEPPLVGRGGHESRPGADGKHLVELSKIWWNCAKHQPEPIRKASAEVAHRRVSLSPRQLPQISPAIFVTVRGSPAPLYGQEMAEMAASRHLVCQQAVP